MKEAARIILAFLFGAAEASFTWAAWTLPQPRLLVCWYGWHGALGGLCLLGLILYAGGCFEEQESDLNQAS